MELPEHIRNPDPSVYLYGKWTVLDFETTNKDFGSALEPTNDIVCSAWYNSPNHPRSGLYSLEAGCMEHSSLIEDIRRSDFIVAHNAKFELQWLERCGMDLTKILCYDTMIGEYVWLGNRKERLDLDSLAKKYKQPSKDNLIKALMRGGVCPSEMPRKVLIDYCKHDVLVTKEIFLAQRQKLHKSNLLPVMYTRCLLTPCLADIEKNGMNLDPERVYKIHEEYSEEYFRALADLDRITNGINVNSPKQLGEYLYGTLGFQELKDSKGKDKKTPSGKPLTDADAISMLVATTPQQREFKAIWDRIQPLKGSMAAIAKMKEAVDDGEVIRARFNQTVTATHRLSSSGSKYKLQFQNFARKFKPLFKARYDGWLMGEADGAQLEFRIAAHLGKDEQARKDIIDNFDVHKFTASHLFAVPMDTVTGSQRQDAKPHTFRPLYAGKGQTDQQRKYVAAFQERYKGIYETQRGWTKEVLNNKKLVTEWGMIYYWPDVKMLESGYITHSTNIYNYPVQALATAEIIPIAVTCFWHRLKSSNARAFLVNTIHDSIIAELPESEEKLFRELANKALTEDVFEYLQQCYSLRFTVPLGVETKVGKHWSEGKEERYEYFPK